MTWYNSDGLMVKFGIEEAVLRNIGAYCTDGPVHWVEILVDHAELPLLADNLVILNDQFAIPAGAVIEGVTITKPTELFDSSDDGETFNLGLINQDRDTGDDAPTSLINAATQAELNAGGRNISGWIDGGDTVVNTGVALTAAKLLTWEVNTTQPTQGKTTIRIEWSIPPKNASDTLVWSKA